MRRPRQGGGLRPDRRGHQRQRRQPPAGDIRRFYDDPLKIDDALSGIDSELDNLNDKTDNADLSKAVDQLSDGVNNVRTAVKDGDNSPDLTPITNAATEIGKICTP